MKINSIEYKITTSTRTKCSMCKSMINGKEGFIMINFNRERGIYPLAYTNVKICWNCFANFSKECEERRKNREKTYDLLLKKRILLGLK